MNFTKATVILSNSADKVILSTDLPSPFVPEYDPEQTPLDLSFSATYDTGIVYVKKTFNLEPTVVNIRH